MFGFTNCRLQDFTTDYEALHQVGDGVTPVALSHHRTCGSAYGGS